MTAQKKPLSQPDLLVRLWHRKSVVALGALVGLLVAIFYLNLVTYKFRAELRVTPSAASKSPALASASPGVGALASIAGISLGATSSASPFDIYMDAILSRDVAAALTRDPRIMHAIFKRDWDARISVWREPVSAIGATVTSIKQIVGIPVRKWHQPNAADLQDYLLRSIQIYKSNASPLTRIQYDDEDAGFAGYLLAQMNISADRKVRADALLQARVYAAYLSVRLSAVTLSELRNRIVDQLARQEELIMIASSDVPYAAAMLEQPTVSDTPVTPQPKLVIPIGLLAGIALGAGAVLWMQPRQRRMRSDPIDPIDAE